MSDNLSEDVPYKNALANVAEDVINGGKVHVHRAEMPQAMVDKAVKKVATCLTEKMLEKDIATSLKQSFDQEYQPTWHCVVGKTFGSSITYETKMLLFAQLDETYVLLFKSQE